MRWGGLENEDNLTVTADLYYRIVVGSRNHSGLYLEQMGVNFYGNFCASIVLPEGGGTYRVIVLEVVNRFIEVVKAIIYEQS